MLTRLAIRTAIAVLVVFQLVPSWAEAPQAEIDNGVVRATLYLPDTKEGFYRGTRFDWGGVIGDLAFQGHRIYGSWFARVDPKVNDFIYDGSDIVASPSTAVAGPAEEFTPALGYDEAKVGGTFVKVGVGILRKPDEKLYSSGRLYEVVNAGNWRVTTSASSATFRQEIHDPTSGYGYVYVKTVSLLKGKAEMVIAHHLENAGTRPIHISVFDHNFLLLDEDAPSPPLTLTFPFQPTIETSGNEKLIETNSNQIVYLSHLALRERAYTGVGGFGTSVSDFKIRVENFRAGLGMTITGDKPLVKMALWSIHPVIGIEPYIDISIGPGKDLDWKYEYTYYTLPQSNTH